MWPNKKCAQSLIFTLSLHSELQYTIQLYKQKEKKKQTKNKVRVSKNSTIVNFFCPANSDVYYQA